MMVRRFSGQLIGLVLISIMGLAMLAGCAAGVAHAETVNLEGTVQAVDSTSLLVDGKTIAVPADLKLPSNLAAGSLVQLAALAGPDGSLTAVSVEVQPASDLLGTPNPTETIEPTEQETIEPTEQETVEPIEIETAEPTETPEIEPADDSGNAGPSDNQGEGISGGGNQADGSSDDHSGSSESGSGGEDDSGSGGHDGGSDG